MMSDLAEMLRSLQPRLNPGVYCYCLLNEDDSIPKAAIGLFKEAEGVSAILPIDVARQLNLHIGFKAEWITLDVHSDLASVGLTARVSTALAQTGISCNIVAGYHHDHLFVPAGQGQQALQVLKELQSK